MNDFLDVFLVYSWDGHGIQQQMKNETGRTVASMEIQESSEINCNAVESNILEDSEDVATFDNTQVHLQLNDENGTAGIQNVPDERAKKLDIRKRFFSRFRRLSEDTPDVDHFNEEETTIDPKMLSDEELLHKYWKLVVCSKNNKTLIKFSLDNMLLFRMLPS